MESKRWSFTEFKAYLEEEDVEKAKVDEDRNVPSHWPPDLEVDTKRQPWLPADWGQGLKTSSLTERKRAVFISPEGKVYQNRRDVEKACGRTFEDVKDPDRLKRKEQIAASEAPPQTYWPEWLPLDWTMSTKMSSGYMRPYYYSPSGRGFFNRGAAEEYIQKSPSATTVKPPASSSPLAGTPPSRSRHKAPDAKDAKAKRKDGAESTTSTSQADPAASPTIADSKNESTQADSEGSPTPKDGSPSSAQQAAQDAPAQADAKNGSATSQEELPRAGAASAESSGGSAPPDAAGGAAAPDAAELPPAKRQRVDGGTTDEEVEQIQDGEQGEGFALHRCRAGAAWLVLPNDVISLDLKAIGGQVEAAGWTCVARNEKRWDFTGSPGLVLYPSGKLLVRSAESEDVGRTAREYVDEWLALDG